MSTQPEAQRGRPRPEETVPQSSLIDRLRSGSASVTEALAIAGVGAIVLGGLAWLFFQDLRTAAGIVMLAGVVLLAVDAVLARDTVRRAVLGRRGRYGVNTMLILIGFVSLAVIANYLLFWAANRPNPVGFLRVDTTATRESILPDQAIRALENLREPVHVTAFFTTNTPEGAAAWRRTEDMLSEFRRRSTVFPLSYELVDPEVNPNIAAGFGITQFPALAMRGVDSTRTEILTGLDPRQTTDVFTQQDVITGLLVVNQIEQKEVMFVSGHAERNVTDNVGPTGYGLAAQALLRENYVITDNTLQELASIMTLERNQWPAVVVFAGPSQDLLGGEVQVLADYARQGGSLMFLLEPDTTPDTFKEFLSRYGIAFGEGEVVDASSYVAPNPLFLQIKQSNGQMPQHPITQGFDVLYLPGTAYLGITVDPQTVPITDSGVPYVIPSPLAVTSGNSWAETNPDTIEYNEGEDVFGRLPVAMTVEAIAELSGAPTVRDGQFIRTNMLIVGDADFASNNFAASARNLDMFVNSVNWLARDFELISIRPRERVFRELVLTTNQRDFVRYTGWLLVPSLLIIVGVGVWWRRR